MMLLSVQFCAGVKVLRDWGIVAVNGDSTVSEVFHGVSSGQIESADGFRLPEQYADSPVSCSIAPTQTGKFQSIPLSIKLQDAVEFGKYLKFVLQRVPVPPTASKDPFAVLMKEAGRQMWPDKYDVTRKNNRQKLHNDVIECLREKELGWSKENVLSAGKPFVTQFGCSTRIETPYFSAECFDMICSYCGSDDILPTSDTPEMYPLCSICKSDPTKPGIFKRKRKLVTESTS